MLGVFLSTTGVTQAAAKTASKISVISKKHTPTITSKKTTATKKKVTTKKGKKVAIRKSKPTTNPPLFPVPEWAASKLSSPTTN